MTVSATGRTSIIKHVQERYWNRVRNRFFKYLPERPENGCWIWQGHLRSNGYGDFNIFNYPYLAHRFSYELAFGPVPEGLVLDHLCRTKACCNPRHLDPVTVKENLLRGGTTITARNSAKTHCPKEHPYTQTEYGRVCEICTRERDARNHREARKRRKLTLI